MILMIKATTATESIILLLFIFIFHYEEVLVANGLFFGGLLIQVGLRCLGFEAWFLFQLVHYIYERFHFWPMGRFISSVLLLNLSGWGFGG